MLKLCYYNIQLQISCSKYLVDGRVFAMIFGYSFSVLIWADSLEVSLIRPRKIELPSARPILLRNTIVRCLDSGLLTGQRVGLVCVHVWPEDFLVAPNLVQSGDQFKYVSCVNGSLEWSWDAWLQDCHIAVEESLGLEMQVLWKEWTTKLFLRPYWPPPGIQPPLRIVQLLSVSWMSMKWD